jgi:hypothetical protein
MKKGIIIAAIVFFSVVVSVAMLAPDFFIDLSLRKPVQAAGNGSSASGVKFFFGGKIKKYSLCTLDAPNSPTCNNSCMECNKVVSKLMPAPGACAGFNEILYVKDEKRDRTEVLCPPKPFIYLGGLPKPSGHFIGFGMNQILPLLIFVTK